MDTLRLYRALSRAPGGYRGKLIACAAAAAALPLAAAVAAGASLPLLIPAVIGVLLALILLGQLLRPIAMVSEGLRSCAEPGDTLDASEGGDEARRMMADVRRLSARLEALRHRLSHRHPITALPTREPFLAQLANTMRDADAVSVLGVIRFVDYDGLAAFDQERADRALQAFAARLEDAVQAGRPIAQVDRDCFAVWFSPVETPQIAASELQAIAYVLSQELGEGELRIDPELGLGAAIFPTDAREPSALLTRAFAAIPKTGRGARKLGFFSAQATDAARERFSIEQGLRHAIGREELLLHYQPVIDLSKGRAVGAEALLRWRHPEFGLVAPSRFIPVLEQSGLMEEVGLWVLNTACRQARAWQDQGLAGLKMAINLSARQCRDPKLPTLVTRTLERHGLSAESIELELTETAAMEDAERTSALLATLRGLGVSVALDDFGAGYSSLSYLKNLPFSKLKIDREFVTKIDERRDSQAICAALVELSRRLGIAVLAEGVETREEVEALRELGCEMFQGFYFARPMEAAQFAATVVDPAWLALASPANREIDGLARRLGA